MLSKPNLKVAGNPDNRSPQPISGDGQNASNVTKSNNRFNFKNIVYFSFISIVLFLALLMAYYFVLTLVFVYTNLKFFIIVILILSLIFNKYKHMIGGTKPLFFQFWIDYLKQNFENFGLHSYRK